MEETNQKYEGKTIYKAKPRPNAEQRRKCIEKECEQCGEPFMAEVRQLKRGYGEYCSSSCAGKHQAEQEDRTGENSRSWKENTGSENKEHIGKIKKQGSCEYCSEERPPCLQFHHKDPEEKEHLISEMVTGDYTLKKLKDEISKCELICANCHRIKHKNNYSL